MCMSAACVRVLTEDRGRAGVTGDCEPPDGSWELNSGLLKEEKVLLISKPSLQP